MGRPSVKTQLVDRTFTVFLSQGYEGASVNDLVAAAGVPKGSFYNHFPSKEALAIEHVRRYIAALELDALADDPAPPLTALRTHFERRIADRAATGLENGCLLGNFSTGVPNGCVDLRTEVQLGFSLWEHSIAEVLRRAQAQHQLVAGASPADLAAFVIGSFEGAIALSKVTRRVDHVADFMKTIFDLLLPRLTMLGKDGS